MTARKVFAVEADPDRIDVRRLDPEDIFGRFETLNRLNYTTESLETYSSRFYRGTSMYLAWLDKRVDWKSANLRAPSKVLAVKSASTGKSSSKPKLRRLPTTQVSNGQLEVLDSVPSAATPMVPYDLPLRPGLRVRLVLPEMLTQADAKRVAAFVNSLASSRPKAHRKEGELAGHHVCGDRALSESSGLPVCRRVARLIN